MTADCLGLFVQLVEKKIENSFEVKTDICFV